jgi:hypothetical protein
MCGVNPDGPERIERVGNLPEELGEADWRNLVSLGGWGGVYDFMFSVRLLPGSV